MANKTQEVIDLIDELTFYRMFGLQTPQRLKDKWKRLQLERVTI